MPELRLPTPLTLAAPAKVNLGLEVTGRRPDGYHDVVTILQAVDLCDLITLRPAQRLRVTTPSIPTRRDLIRKALELARDEWEIDLRADVIVNKRIPVAAGLGGGSSDAGTLLGALARLSGREPAEAETLAAQLGSDVPFFVRGGTALATGTGTTLFPLPSPRDAWFVIATPNVRIPGKTQRLYGALTATDRSTGEATLTQAEHLRRGEPLDPALLRNAFTRPLLDIPEVRRLVEAFRSAGIDHSLPSGAGPSVFALVNDETSARAVAARLEGTGAVVHVCQGLGGEE